MYVALCFVDFGSKNNGMHRVNIELVESYRFSLVIGPFVTVVAIPWLYSDPHTHTHTHIQNQLSGNYMFEAGGVSYRVEMSLFHSEEEPIQTMTNDQFIPDGKYMYCSTLIVYVQVYIYTLQAT